MTYDVLCQEIWVLLAHGGYHLRRNQYDKMGNLVEQTYFGVDGKPVPDATDGAYRFAQSFDRFRNPVLTKYFDAEGRPINNAQGFHRRESSYDDYGEILATHWYDKDGLPAKGPEGVHFLNYTRDRRRGLLMRTARFDVGNQPAVDKDGIHETLYDYNDKRLQTKWQNFGLKRRPVNNADGDHLILREFDERGRETKLTQLRADGSPNVDRELGIATWTRVYDKKNDWIEQAFYDPKMHLVTGWHGFAKGSMIHHEDGRVEYRHYGPDGRLELNPLVGYAIKKTDPRRRGDTVESYHGPDGALVTGPEGYAEVRRHWGDDGTLLAEAWFGPGGSPVAGPGGWHRMEHASGGHKTRYFDVQNRELTSLGQDSIVSVIFVAEITDVKQPAVRAGIHAGDILWRYGNWWFPKDLEAERAKGTKPDAILLAVAQAFFAERDRPREKPAALTVLRDGRPMEIVVPPLAEKNLGVRLKDRAIPVATFEQWKRMSLPRGGGEHVQK